MNKSITFAVISFAICAIIAGFTGSIMLVEFALSTHASSVAQVGMPIGMIFIISFLGAVTLPIILMIQGLLTQRQNRILNKE